MRTLWATLLLLMSGLPVFGQDIRNDEQELLEGFRKLYAPLKEAEARGISKDTLYILRNLAFKDKMADYMASIPSMDYPFDLLKQEGMYIATTADGNFRIFSWDTGRQGKGKIFDNVLQFRYREAVSSVRFDFDEQQPVTWFYTTLYTLQLPKEGKVYLAVEQAVLSRRTAYSGLKAFTVDSTGVKEECLIFKTPDGRSNALGFEYNITAGSDPGKQVPGLIGVDEQKQTLTFPIISNGQITGKTLIYTFNGNYFEAKKTR